MNAEDLHIQGPPDPENDAARRMLRCCQLYTWPRSCRKSSEFAYTYIYLCKFMIIYV